MHNFNSKYTKVSLRIVEISKSNLTAMDYLHNDKNKRKIAHIFEDSRKLLS